MGTVRWFGRTWGASVCDPDTHIETPAGQECAGCGGAVVEGHQGITLPYARPTEADMQPTRIAYHLDCWLQAIGAPTGLLPQWDLYCDGDFVYSTADEPDAQSWVEADPDGHEARRRDPGVTRSG